MSYGPLEMANAFIQAGELPDALDALNQHLEANSGDVEARRLRAEVLARQDAATQLEAALGDLDALPTLTPADIMLRADLLLRLDRADEALTALRAGRNNHPDDERLAEALVTRLQASGALDAARQVVTQMIAASGDASWRWLGWAGDLARAANAQPDAAPDTLETAIKHYSTALAAIESRYTFDPDRAATILEAEPAASDGAAISEASALTVVAAYARLLLARAAAHRQLHHHEAAHADLLAAGRLVPNEPAVPFGRGVIAYLRGNRDSALALCELGLRMASDTVRAHLLDELRGEVALADLLAALDPESN